MLPRNNEWEYAHEFISMSAVLDDERREGLPPGPFRASRTSRSRRRNASRRSGSRQEERIRRDIEEARRLRAENEERESKRLEEERARRQAATTEGDYGVEQTPSPSSVAKSRPVPGQPKSTPRPLPGTRKGKAVVGPPSLGKRASTVLTACGRSSIRCPRRSG